VIEIFYALFNKSLLEVYRKRVQAGLIFLSELRLGNNLLKGFLKLIEYYKCFVMIIFTRISEYVYKHHGREPEHDNLYCFFNSLNYHPYHSEQSLMEKY